MIVSCDAHPASRFVAQGIGEFISGSISSEDSKNKRESPLESMGAEQ
jgi:hypothetical protein